MAHRYVYILIYPDGQKFQCNFAEIMDRLERDFSVATTESFRNLVCKRLFAYKNKRVPAAEIALPPRTTREAGALRWAQMGVPCINGYTDVEGIDGQVSARQVWQTLVVNAGKRGPAKETIRKRLKRGARRQAELLADRPVGRPMGWNGVPVEKVIRKSRAPVKKQVLPKSTVSAVLHRAQQLPVVSGCGNELPPMRDLVVDQKFFRRMPLR